MLRRGVANSHMHAGHEISSDTCYIKKKKTRKKENGGWRGELCISRAGIVKMNTWDRTLSNVAYAGVS